MCVSMSDVKRKSPPSHGKCDSSIYHLIEKDGQAYRVEF